MLSCKSPKIKAFAPNKLPTWNCQASWFKDRHEDSSSSRVVSQWWLQLSLQRTFIASHLGCAKKARTQFQDTVKLHRVFLSRFRKSASSRTSLFHRVSLRDSAQIVTPFVQVETYSTMNFACYVNYWFPNRPDSILYYQVFFSSIFLIFIIPLIKGCTVFVLLDDSNNLFKFYKGNTFLCF